MEYHNSTALLTSKEGIEMLRQKSCPKIAVRVALISLCALFLCALYRITANRSKTFDVMYGGNTRFIVSEVEASERDFSLRSRLFRTLAGCSGLGEKELLSLTWDDMDFENSTISITKTSVAVGAQIVTLPTPRNRRRIVSIPRGISQQLQQLKHRQSPSCQFVFPWQAVDKAQHRTTPRLSSQSGGNRGIILRQRSDIPYQTRWTDTAPPEGSGM